MTLFYVIGSLSMKNNGVTKEFYISQSGIKVSSYPSLYIWGVHLIAKPSSKDLVINNSFTNDNFIGVQ